MFHPQRAALPHIETPDWIPHVPRESLQAYARRLAESLNIREPAILGGVSMGGMIALEMARVVPTRSVILIGSARRIGTLNPWLKWSERASRLSPTILLDKGRLLAPIFLGRGGLIPREDRKLLIRMAQEMRPEFLRWAARALIEWPGCADPGVPVHSIHGDRDWVFAAGKIKPDHVIAKGSHVLNLSHPREVNDFIAEKSGLKIQ